MASLIRLTSVAVLGLMLLGCSAKPRVITETETEIVKVNIPVVYNLERPERPKFTTEDTSPSYLLKILEYVESLEIIIDEHKAKGD